nr:MAG TPA: hypothetical protein [Caudoviricetes sp.]
MRFLVPSRNRRRIITLLQGRHKSYTGRFHGVVSWHHTRDFVQPCTVWAAPRGQGSTVVVIPSPGNPPIFLRKSERFLSGNFFSDFSPVIVDSR